MKAKGYIILLTLVSVTLIRSLFVPARALAFDHPQVYFDWTTYQAGTTNVLGETTQPDYKTFTTHTYLFGTGNLTPKSPFYFFKQAEEGMALTFTFDPKAREKMRLEIAGERLSEMQELVKSGDAKALETLAKYYQQDEERLAQDLRSLKKQGKDVKDLSTAIDTETAKHELLLEQLVLEVPKQAESEVQTALESSQKTTDTVADVLGKPAVPDAVVQRLQALKAQGILTEEEVQKLISTSSRQEAREEMRKYVESNIVPQADFKKFDETAASKFPQGYYANVELTKFNELARLETQKPNDETIKKIQEFSKTYKPGDVVPQEIRSWWAPMIRLEELQNTIRPDLINQDLLKNRPDDQQKYKEIVERVKPRTEDIQYINTLIKNNPNILNDPSYARIKALADAFGTAQANTASQTQNQSQACSDDSHWASIPFMPNGGYCVPNITYSTASLSQNNDKNQFTITPCPPGYHRNDPQGACYPNNASGAGLKASDLPAPGSCPSGYKWFATSFGGYCNPEYTGQGGAFPSPIAPPAYCPAGQMFMEGKCQTYNPPPTNGCPSGQYWSGTSCVIYKSCGYGYYQGTDGECQAAPTQGTSPSQYSSPANTPPSSQNASCGTGYYWNGSACVVTPPPSSPPPGGSSGSMEDRASQEAACNASGGVCTSSSSDFCGCNGGSRPSDASSQPNTQPMSQPQSQPPPPPPQSNPQPPSDPAAECGSHGGTWSNGTCTGAQ